MNEYQQNGYPQNAAPSPAPIRCPRCGNMTFPQVCSWCGLDFRTGVQLTQPGYAPPVQGQYPSQPGYAPPVQGQYPSQPGYVPPVRQAVPPQPGYAPPVQQAVPPQPGYAPPVRQAVPPQPGYVPPVQQAVPPQPGYVPPVRQAVPPQPGYHAPSHYVGYPAGQIQPSGYPMVPPPARQKNTGLIVGLICAAAVLLIVAAIVIALVYDISMTANSRKDETVSDSFLANPSTQEKSEHPEGVSAEEYAMLRKGMNYATISAIIGSDGTLLQQEKDENGDELVIFGWYGESDVNAVVYITFTNGEVTEIENEGLTDK